MGLFEKCPTRHGICCEEFQKFSEIKDEGKREREAGGREREREREREGERERGRGREVENSPVACH